MTPEQLEETKKLQESHLREAIGYVESGTTATCSILDEVLDAYQLGLLDPECFGTRSSENGGAPRSSSPATWRTNGSSKPPITSRRCQIKHPYDIRRFCQKRRRF
jgi:hypothetical protein